MEASMSATGSRYLENPTESLDDRMDCHENPVAAPIEDRSPSFAMNIGDQTPAPGSPASSGIFSAPPSPAPDEEDVDAFASADSDIDSGAEEDSDEPLCPSTSSLVEVQGLCHINLLAAKFVISHNEQTNDFFLDLVREGGADASILSAIFRFPPHRNGTLEVFTASYESWSRPGQLVYHDDSPACTSAVRFGSCRHAAATGARRRDADRRTHWHLQLHVYEQCYTIELNGQEIARHGHRLAFEKIRCAA